MRIVDLLFAVYEAGGPEWWRRLVFRVALLLYGRRRMVQAVRDYNATQRESRR